MSNLLDKMLIKLICRINSLVEEETGDTNFISIIVILGIVMALVGVFITFKEEIIKRASELITSNLNKIQ